MDSDRQTPEINAEVNRGEKKKERRGGGFWASFGEKLGLGGAGGTGGAAGAGSPSLAGGLLATKAGLVALILAGTTVAAGIGVVGRSVVGSYGGPGAEAMQNLFSVFPEAGKRDAPGAARNAAGSDGVSSSLDYFAKANPEGAGAGDGAASADAASSEAPGAPAPDHSNAPANVGSTRPQLAKTAGFAGASASGAAGGPRLAVQPGLASGVGSGFQPVFRSGSTGAFARNKASESGRRKSSSIRSGGNARSQLNKAFGQSRSALGNRNASVGSSAPVFDNGSRATTSAPDGGIAAASEQTAEGSPNAAFQPNTVVDRSEVPEPPKPKKDKDVTPYRWAMYVATAALGIAFIALLAMNHFKNQARIALTASPFSGPALAAALNGAKICAMIAAAAGAAATAMGVIMMTTYGQKMQGLIFTGVGAMVAATAASSWSNLGGAQELAAKETGSEIAAAKSDTIGQMMNSSLFGK